jgi:acetoin utilization deacetylase AcuC-like enzyme
MDSLVPSENVIHIPLPPQVTGKKFRSLFDEVYPKLEAYNPEIIFLSAGFDAHRGDTTKVLPLPTRHQLKFFSLQNWIFQITCTSPTSSTNWPRAKEVK